MKEKVGAPLVGVVLVLIPVGLFVGIVYLVVSLL